MINFFDEDRFIRQRITGRDQSLFQVDLLNHSGVLREKIQNKSILVIGGAGTIGSSFIKSCLKYHPSRLVVVDHSENGLTELTRDLRSSKNIKVPDQYLTYPINFGGNVFKKLIRNNSFDIVASFAAHKHVRSEKDHYSVEAMIRNNVFNTYDLLSTLSANPPKHFFCVSTDKAANPVNVMGASKKLMEHILFAFASEFKISTARFANVAFSNGSLLAGFINRVMKNQPLSSPSDVKRYFLSPQESGELCLLACIMGESRDIHFPKLNAESMMSFSSICEKFLNELGYESDYCKTESEAKEKAANRLRSDTSYPVYFFESDTSGEKLYEEFYEESDLLDMRKFQSLGIIKNTEGLDKTSIQSILIKFEDLLGSPELSKEKIVGLLEEVLPDFHHIEKGKNLDQRM